MANLGIMIEGQEDLTWDRFFRLAQAVEELGFTSLFRSDHLTSLDGFPQRATLALWPSLTVLALRTERIRFGPMVCSVTFRHPAMLAKMAADIDLLSGGRLDLGLGAGWFEGEHEMFGIDFPPYRQRLARLDEAAHVIRRLWSGAPSTFEGETYRLQAAENHPPPLSRPPTLIMGGKGERTLQVVARHATEWNCSYEGVDTFRQKSAELDEAALAAGRDPASIRRSIMIPFVVGHTEAALQERIDAHRRTFPNLLPRDFEAWRAAGFIGGSPAAVTEQITAFVEAGADRFMLQHNDLDDVNSLELMAADVLPHFREGANI